MKVLSLFPFGPVERARLEGVSPLLHIEHGPGATRASVDELVDPQIEVLLSAYAPSDPRRLPALKWVASVTAGIEEIAATDPWRHGITVTNGSGLHASAMGEYVLGTVLGVTQRTADRLDAQRDRRWPAWSSPPWVHLAGTRLRGTTALIVGYGSVGREIGRLLSAFGVRIVAVKARPDAPRDDGFRLPGTGDPAGEIPEHLIGFDALAGALGDADFVVITVPLTDQTRRLVDAPFLSRMRRDAWLINVGRGGHADEAALIGALRAGRIAGAVLDVFDDEPLPEDSPFWALPNVILTPHLAGAGGPKAFWPDASRLLAENLRRYVAGDPLLNVIDGARGY